MSHRLILRVEFPRPDDGIVRAAAIQGYFETAIQCDGNPMGRGYGGMRAVIWERRDLPQP